VAKSGGILRLRGMDTLAVISSPRGTYGHAPRVLNNTGTQYSDIGVMKVDGSDARALVTTPSGFDVPQSWRAAPVSQE
jgi:hypothetical protein